MDRGPPRRDLREYVLLGCLIEKIIGQSYAEFLSTKVLGLSGMQDSGVDSGVESISQMASGYALVQGKPVGADFVDMSSAHAAGAIYSTTEDLWRWEEGLFGGKLLSRHALEKMTRPFLQDYACGLHVEQREGRKVIYHSGRIDGFSAHLVY